ncbi:trypsin-like peptidase domain-containing protein [Streptomyces sp. NPDC056468]|uniref:trypsin-like peptidase domain-containing protein n=1 Tax=Streptomyces sp. NPDC056468 TaxID=3345830 RepID=UPI0036859656
MGRAGAVTALSTTTRDLLTAATVALMIRSPDGASLRSGTGFLIAPGTVATCAHVVADSAETLPEVVYGRVGGTDRELRLRPAPDLYFRDRTTGLDLALLRVVADAGGLAALVDPWVLFHDDLRDGDRVWVRGHPEGMFRSGQSVELDYQGPSSRDLGGPGLLERFWGPPIGGGYSGSAILNKRTGAVCGMLCTSDHSGSVHALSTAALLSRCPQQVQELHKSAARAVSSRVSSAVWDVDQPWLRTLTDDQLQAGGWAFPSRRLRGYLAAAARAAESHPYPGVAPGNVSPPLSTVYVSQHAHSIQTLTRPDQPDTEERVSAATIIENHMDALAIGGPGAGKSSLLRSFVRECVAWWGDGWAGDEGDNGGGGTGDGADEQSAPQGPGPRPDRTPRPTSTPLLVPVYIQAADLVPDRPLSEALEAGVRADAGRYGPLETWSAEFFRGPPTTHASWLVLVDGLDELLASEQRQVVLTRLAGIRAADPQGTMYRCVIATRPVPELPTSRSPAWRAAVFDLLPFDTRQLRDFAERWLNALGLPDPERAAEQFTLQFGERRREALVRVPLMATMLCQLFADQPKPPLPTTRHEVYRSFIGLLQSRQYSDAASGIIAQATGAAAKYGTTAVRTVERLPAQVVGLAGELALAWLDGEQLSAGEVFAARTEDQRPPDLPEPVWREILCETFRRSGLFTERGGDLVFIHQTLLEFLAAQRVAEDPRRADTELRNVFGRWVRRPPQEWRRHDSFTRFLIAAVTDRPLLGRALWRCGKGWEGARFIAELVADGIPVAPKSMRRCADTLAAAAKMPECTGFFRRELAQHLRTLGDDRDARILTAVATDPMVSDDDRIKAARALGALRGSGYTESLLSIAADTDVGLLARVEAMQRILEVLDDTSRGRQLLAIVADPVFHDGLRRDVLNALRSADPRGCTELFLSYAQDSELGQNARALALRELAAAGDRRAPALLLALAGESTADSTLRFELMRTLRSTDADRYAELLASYGADSDLDPGTRVTALGELAHTGDERAADLLASLAAELDADPVGGERVQTTRLRVAEQLAQLHDPRADELFTTLAGDMSVVAPIRLGAAHELQATGHASAADVFAALAADRVLDEHARVAAAQALTTAEPGGHSPRLTAILVQLVIDPEMPETARDEAFRLLDWYVAVVHRVQDPRDSHRPGAAEGVLELLTRVADDANYSRLQRAWAAKAMRNLPHLRRRREGPAPWDPAPDTPGGTHQTRTRLPDP